MPFTLTERHLEMLFEAANFELPANEMIFAGLRGCFPVALGGSDFAGSHPLEYIGTDYRHLRCTLLQWKPGSGFAVFPGSTVPHEDSVRARISANGVGVNQLALGFYQGRHGYRKDDHMRSKPERRHRAFVNDSVLPVWRTGDDTDFEGDDRLDTNTVPGDNIHCAWQQNAAADNYSSLGCQVVVGRPRVLARDWTDELGPWARFVDNAYALPQQRFRYALFSGREVLALATAPNPADRYQTVRFGSTGELVELVQLALLRHGFDVGTAGADGECGFGTITALRKFQTEHFGPVGVDLIVGATTAQVLGMTWPKLGGALPPIVDALPPLPGAPPLPSRPASASGAAEAAEPNYRSLTPGGFFSDKPFDTSVKRAIRTNNPGALNISQWQRTFPGFAGITGADGSGNRTTIYVTPEHGICAWHHLLANRYGFGEHGTLKVGTLARKYAGVASETDPAARTYITGWRRWSGNTLTAASVLRLDDDADMVVLARAMFAHEIGAQSPLNDDQITNALTLRRNGTLPND